MVDAYLDYSPLVHERIRQQAAMADKAIRDRRSIARSERQQPAVSTK
jgi:hypothetical protein